MDYDKLAELKNFYATDLGVAVQNNINNAINTLWPALAAEIIIGIGYTAHLLQDKINNNLTASIIPVNPRFNIQSGKIQTLVSRETDLPLSDNSVDRIIVMHLLEHSKYHNLILREIWRVLKPGGKLLVIVPNKYSLWPHTKELPFNNCALFTIPQIHNLFNHSMFATLRTRASLFAFSMLHNTLPDFSNLLEHWGNKWLYPCGELLLFEAEKMVCVVPETRGNVVSEPKKLAFNISRLDSN